MLVERFQSGEISAFDEIVERYHRHVYNLAYHFTRNYEDAYDISQEVFIKIFKSLSKLKNRSAFGMWLRKITVNTCIDHLRQRPDEEALDTSSYTSGGRSANTRKMPDSPVEIAELRSVIAKAVGRLPRKQKAVFILRHYEDISLEKIAETLACPVGTVKANLFHATRRLRKLLLHYIS